MGVFSDDQDRHDGSASLDYTVDITRPNITGDIGYGPMMFLRNNNPNGLSPTLHKDQDGGAWPRLAVACKRCLPESNGR
jgi:hypothetical protein